MNRGSQFFIATIVLIALSISVTVINLYIPEELNIREGTNKDLIENALFVKEVLKEVSNYFRLNWELPYSHRTKIELSNDFSLNDYTVSARIDLPNNAYVKSLKLVDGAGQSIPFGIEYDSMSQRIGTIFFQANSESISSNNYYLYYNTAPDSVIINNQERQYSYGEDVNGVWFKSGSYYAWVNKTGGGHIDNINISGDSSFLNDYDHFINCASGEYLLNESANKELTITPTDYYLKLKFTGSRFANETYTITELFFPDEVMIIDKMSIAAYSDCSVWGSRININRNDMINYIDSVGNFYEPTGPVGLMYAGNALWQEMYGGGYSIGWLSGNESPIYLAASASASWGERHFINTTNGLNAGTYLNNFTITPLVGARYNATGKFSKPSANVINEKLANKVDNLFGLINNYFYDLNVVVTHESSYDERHEARVNVTDWYYNLGLRSNCLVSYDGSFRPLELTVRLQEPDPNSILTHSGSLISHQVSTNNYHDWSEFNNSMNNSVVNNSLLLFNPDGQDFNVTVIKSSDGDLKASGYYYGNSLFKDTIIGSVTKIEYNGVSKAGFYNLSLEGSANFIVNTTLPKIIAGLPITLSNASPIYLLYNESMNNTRLNITTYSGTNGFTLYDPLGNNISSISTTVGTYQINEAINPCINDCVYKLVSDSEGAYTLNSTNKLFISTDEKYMINPYYSELTIINNHQLNSNDELTIYYNDNTHLTSQQSNSDLTYSESEFEVNNSKISFDFDDMKLIYEGVNWLGSRGWLSCTDACTNLFKDLRFVEKGSERVVVYANTSVGLEYYFHLYPNTTLIKVITQSNTNYSFGPLWIINNSDDLYYNTKEGYQNLGNGFNYLNKESLKGPTDYVTKSDEYSDCSVVFNTNVLEAYQSINVSDTGIIIKAYKPSTFYFLINEEPITYLKPITYSQDSMIINYSYTGNGLSINDALIS